MASTCHSHARSSGSSNSSAGSSYQLILDHILSYPGSYEIPLRSMYSLNCASRAQPLPSAASSPNIPQGSFSDQQTSPTFTENLMAQISQLPTQPTSLPPSFITTYLYKIFPAELLQVDFVQALTGLDYLKDLEYRRRREVAAAMARLEIDSDLLERDADALAGRYPGVAQWVKSIEEKERKTHILYTQLYIGLRRWVLINEMSLLPFHKHNCVAMLNTLYPPIMSNQPTNILTPAVMKVQRNGFLKYIQSVDKSGPKVLETLVQQGRAINDSNGWSAVTRTMSMYLQIATSMINECLSIGSEQDVSPRKESRHSRKADSGVSFGGSEKRPPTQDSSSEPTSPIEAVRPKTPSGNRSGTTLEKIARGLKTIGRSRTDVTEMVQDDSGTAFPALEKEKPKTLRKMRSMGSLGSRESSKTSFWGVKETSIPADVPAFDVAAMRRQRMKFEAGVATPNSVRD